MTPEKRIQNEICSYLTRIGVFCFVHDSVGIFNRKAGVFMKNTNPYRRRGVSDVLAVYKGRFLAIEVKTKTGRLSEYQTQFIRDINSHGGIAFVARSVEDVQSYLTAWQQGQTTPLSLKGVLKS